MHFLQLPIEDQFLDTLEAPSQASAVVATALHPPRPAAPTADKPTATPAAPNGELPTSSAAPASGVSVSTDSIACDWCVKGDKLSCSGIVRSSGGWNGRPWQQI